MNDHEFHKREAARKKHHAKMIAIAKGEYNKIKQAQTFDHFKMDMRDAGIMYFICHIGRVNFVNNF